MHPPWPAPTSAGQTSSWRQQRPTLPSSSRSDTCLPPNQAKKLARCLQPGLGLGTIMASLTAPPELAWSLSLARSLKRCLARLLSILSGC